MNVWTYRVWPSPESVSVTFSSSWLRNGEGLGYTGGSGLTNVRLGFIAVRNDFSWLWFVMCQPGRYRCTPNIIAVMVRQASVISLTLGCKGFNCAHERKTPTTLQVLAAEALVTWLVHQTSLPVEISINILGRDYAQTQTVIDKHAVELPNSYISNSPNSV